MAHDRPGPVPKGKRTSSTVRFPDEHIGAYNELAQTLGLPLGDYVVMHMAIAHGKPLPAYIEQKLRHDKNQQELQLGA